MKHSIIKDIDTSNHPTRGIPLMRIDDIEEAERGGVVVTGKMGVSFMSDSEVDVYKRATLLPVYDRDVKQLPAMEAQ